jgi:predicted RNase H-like HicB family nuclease
MDNIQEALKVKLEALAQQNLKRKQEKRLAFIEAMKIGDFEAAALLIWK